MSKSVATKLFQSNRSQAVRLPRDVAFPDHVKEVVIRIEGNRRIIEPAQSGWAAFFAKPGFDMPEIEPRIDVERESF
ncbi:type II toxin-antitoxin system VapB family antitoxin [Sandarakinorhabdus sp.]|uniref:type II toxin-antitoxin system VapB family antitoxin n=1 Tax=Sandarakinorhabdus sp. TaxID=1916663 RepID=UPI003F71D8EF